ncbi:hypothetical protein GE21DRAFT_1276370 [Neurospora crassa]|nr:hypothetical protein GE21DRAFT_1276370 [Neurospora crassa]
MLISLYKGECVWISLFVRFGVLIYLVITIRVKRSEVKVYWNAGYPEYVGYYNLDYVYGKDVVVLLGYGTSKIVKNPTESIGRALYSYYINPSSNKPYYSTINFKRFGYIGKIIVVKYYLQVKLELLKKFEENRKRADNNNVTDYEFDEECNGDEDEFNGNKGEFDNEGEIDNKGFIKYTGFYNPYIGGYSNYIIKPDIFVEMYWYF